MKYLSIPIAICLCLTASAQKDSLAVDTAATQQDAVYQRPFIAVGNTATAVGGYIEGNTNYFAEDGISEGFSMELRRFNVFLYSAINQRIQLISELEFEHGTEEIALETALLDFEVNPSLNFRGGILLPQIGLFNANHDAPRWEMIDRPLSSTLIIPSTLSEVGFGAYGKFFPGNFILSYDFYVVNGLQEDIILNEENRTFIPAGKREEMFGEDNNGVPMFNSRVAVVTRIAEAGISYYGGVYNRFQLDGEEVEPRRKLTMLALDVSSQLGKATVQGEFVSASIDVPADINDLFGSRQWGGFVEVIYPFLQTKIHSWENATFNVVIRGEAVDFNAGTFSLTDTRIGDEIKAIGGGISFRPGTNAVIKANYRYHWITDHLNNPAARLAGFQFGIASYF